MCSTRSLSSGARTKHGKGYIFQWPTITSNHIDKRKGAGTVNDDVVKGEYIYKYIHIYAAAAAATHTIARGKDQRQSQSAESQPRSR